MRRLRRRVRRPRACADNLAVDLLNTASIRVSSYYTYTALGVACWAASEGHGRAPHPGECVSLLSAADLDVRIRTHDSVHDPLPCGWAS